MKKDLAKLFEETIKEEYICDDKYGYLSQMSILVAKSLIPDKEKIGVHINYERYIKEMDLWMDYRTGDNESLLNIKNMDNNIYWKGEDPSIIYRIIPLLISNTEEKIFLSEMIKNILFTTGNLKELFKNISIGYLFFLIINNIDEKEERLKDMIIKFSQKEFIEHFDKFYRLERMSYPDNYAVDFEKEKIHIINLFNGIYREEYKDLSNILNVLNDGKPETSIGNILFNYIKGNPDSVELPVFYKNMGSYLMNLRTGKVPREALEVKEYILPDIFKFQVGEKFHHTLLNDSEIIKREEKNGIIQILVRTKTGVYLFRR